MTDDSDLEGHEPYAPWRAELDRLAAFFAGVEGEGWDAPTRCEGWSVRDMLGHLVSSDGYHRACLGGSVAQFLTEGAARGGHDIGSFNALGIADMAGRVAGELLDEWRTSHAAVIDGFEALGDGDVDTSVGPYPARWQAFHVAGEIAIHADDVYAPVPDDAREARRRWRVAFSRFALREAKPDYEVSAEGPGTRVRGGGVDVVVEDDRFIEAVAGRDATPPLADEVRSALSTMP